VIFVSPSVTSFTVPFHSLHPSLKITPGIGLFCNSFQVIFIHCIFATVRVFYIRYLSRPHVFSRVYYTQSSQT